MIRVLNCKDSEGNPYQIKAFKDERISNYEILLPMDYRILYGGLEEYYIGLKKNQEINLSFLADDEIKKKFNKVITIINLNSLPINTQYLQYNNRDRDIEILKYVVSNSYAIKIFLNDDYSLYDCVFMYEIINGLSDDEINLYNEDYLHENYLTSERYN